MDEQTGFLVRNVEQAVQALGRLSEINRHTCRHRVEACFSVDTMVAAYEQVYATIFEIEEQKYATV